MVIRPLSGTSSFSKDSAVHELFCLQRRSHLSQKVNYFRGIKIWWIESLATSCITGKPKKTTVIFMVIVFTISCKIYNHRCQRKQMHRNYFRITTALCHLTAVLSYKTFLQHHGNVLVLAVCTVEIRLR